jgi:hypothetical protein
LIGEVGELLAPGTNSVQYFTVSRKIALLGAGAVLCAVIAVLTPLPEETGNSPSIRRIPPR